VGFEYDVRKGKKNVLITHLLGGGDLALGDRGREGKTLKLARSSQPHSVLGWGGDGNEKKERGRSGSLRGRDNLLEALKNRGEDKNLKGETFVASITRET